MECSFESRHVPCPPEREAEWREAMRVIAELLFSSVVLDSVDVE